MNIKDKITLPNCITSMRLLGAIGMIFTPIFSTQFYILYTFCGITDVLDGFVARMTKKTSEFGAKLDSVADLLFYFILVLKLYKELMEFWLMPIMFISLILIRIASYSIAAIKYHKFASLHTYMNKLTGFAVFTIPYILMPSLVEKGFINPNIVYLVVYVIAMLAAIEEIFIHLSAGSYKTKNRTVIKVVKDNKNG